MPVILIMTIIIVIAVIIIFIMVILVTKVFIGALRLFTFQQNFSCGPQRLHANLPGWPHSLEAEMFGLWGSVQSVPSNFLLSLKCPNPALKLTLQG